MATGRGDAAGRLEPEHELQRVVDRALLLGCEATRPLAEAIEVDGPELLDHHGVAARSRASPALPSVRVHR
jgi:hypothetical protein